MKNIQLMDWLKIGGVLVAGIFWISNVNTMKEKVIENKAAIEASEDCNIQQDKDILTLQTDVNYIKLNIDKLQIEVDKGFDKILEAIKRKK